MKQIKILKEKSKQRANNKAQKNPPTGGTKNTPGLQKNHCRALDRVAVGYPPLEVMRQAVQQTNDERNENKTNKKIRSKNKS